MSFIYPDEDIEFRELVMAIKSISYHIHLENTPYFTQGWVKEQTIESVRAELAKVREIAYMSKEDKK
jgi:hypothetical protein